MNHVPIIYDLETYPNCFLAGFMDLTGNWGVFEISDRVNQSAELMKYLRAMQSEGITMVGFNNLGFDYPIIHTFMKMGRATADVLYNKAMAIIGSQDGDDRWAHQVYTKDRSIPQTDLYKIHHFDNNSRRTSLKALEFSMRMDNIQELPFEVGTYLNDNQKNLLTEYLENDLKATLSFYKETTPMIEFREELTQKYGRDFMNHNDTKIGKDYFAMRLEQAGVELYEYGPEGRQPRQTKRPQIHLNQAILPWIRFEQPEFNRVLDWLKQQVITETKGVFKDLTATIDGFEFAFGLGGIHGSVESQVVESDDEWVVIDLDVASYYPNIPVAQRFYPAHLGEVFCDIYLDVYQQRKAHPKKQFPAINAMLKLALNGVYGDSNNLFSIFYDPLYTMSTTLNGQLFLCLLSEQMMKIDGLIMIQANTDGITVRVRRTAKFMVDIVARWWEDTIGLELEEAIYSRMFVRDCNNYIGEYTDGSLKRKGAYAHETPLDNPNTGEVGWHKDASALVIPKVAEKILLHGGNIRDEVEKHDDRMDFMLRVKVPKSSRLVVHRDGVDDPVQNLTRYYVSEEGGELVKIMPPTPKMIREGKTENRRIAVQKGWRVCVCNDIRDARDDINYDYYVNEVEKLIMGLR